MPTPGRTNYSWCWKASSGLTSAGVARPNGPAPSEQVKCSLCRGGSSTGRWPRTRYSSCFSSRWAPATPATGTTPYSRHQLTWGCEPCASARQDGRSGIRHSVGADGLLARTVPMKHSHLSLAAGLLFTALVMACQPGPSGRADRAGARTDSALPDSAPLVVEEDSGLTSGEWSLVALAGQAAPLGAGDRPATIVFTPGTNRVAG